MRFGMVGQKGIAKYSKLPLGEKEGMPLLNLAETTWKTKWPTA